MKRHLIRLGIGAGLLLPALLLQSAFPLPALALFLTAYLTVGYDVLWKAGKNLCRGRMLDEKFLMTVATLGAFCVNEPGEAVAVMLFFQLGEWFEKLAVRRSRRSVAALMQIRPDHANRSQNGEWVSVSPSEIAVGEVILIRPGERVPLDGTVLEGSSSLDTAALTGESLPQTVGAGDPVLSGCINQSGVLLVQVKKPYAQSTVARILSLVETASAKKSKTESFITRFAQYYTPAVIGAALLLALLPPLFLGIGSLQVWRLWLYRALNFLVVSCPCALVISVPLAFFGGIGGGAKQGILFKGGTYLELLARASAFAFDKTGTLTRGTLQVTALYPSPASSQEALLCAAAQAEAHSTHPIALSLLAAAKENDLSLPKEKGEIRELPGQGVSARFDTRTLLVGTAPFLRSQGVDIPQQDLSKADLTAVFCSENGTYLGCILLSDTLKPDAQAAFSQLKQQGVKETVLLTGDRQGAADAVARQLGITKVHAQLLPEAKVSSMEALLAERRFGKEAVVYVGDGINDAPVLACADVGIAMGAFGTDAAMESADIVLMNDRLQDLPFAIAIARRTCRIAKQNIVFALGVKLSVLLLCALGIVGMWAAVFADVGVSFLAILNALRALHPPKHPTL